MKREIAALRRYIMDKNYRFLFNASEGKYDDLPDEEYLSRYYQAYYHEKLNLDNPVTFSEKLQFLKLRFRDEQLTPLVDKYKVRSIVADLIGEQYLIPLIGVWDKPEDIPFEELPSSFVLKCNHNSGTGMVICRDKKTLDVNKAVEGLKKGLAENYYLKNREWPYKNVQRKIICEKYMKDNKREELADYKFYCFNGNPLFCQVILDRSTHETVDFFDMEWEHQDFTGFGMDYARSISTIDCPRTFNEMKRCARVLAQQMPFVRVDFYEINGRMFFGEITFYPHGGFGNFYPTCWNKTMGDLIKL